MQPVVYLIVLILLVHIITGCQYSGTPSNKQSDFVDSLKEKRIADSNYYISLPEDFVIKAQDGEDFSIYYLSPIDTSKAAPFIGGIYFGNYPSLFEAANDSCITSQIEKSVLDGNVVWTVNRCGSKYSAQVIVDSNSGENWNSKMHLFGDADSKEGLQKMLDIYATLRLKH